MARLPITVNTTHVGNILDCIGRADTDTYDAGAAWYSQWGEYLSRVATAQNIRFDTATAVFACLSANKGLAGNLRMFHHYLNTGIDSIREATSSQKDKLRLLSVSDTPLALLTSNKVGTFAANLAGDTHRVTIDRHAAQCAHNERTIDVVPNRLYKTVEMAFQQAGAMCGIEPRQAQAIAWVQWRMEKPNRRGLTLAGDPDITALLAEFNAVDPLAGLDMLVDAEDLFPQPWSIVG